MAEKSKGNFVGFVVVFVFMVLFLINRWIQNQIELSHSLKDKGTQPSFTSNDQQLQSKSRPEDTENQSEVIRRTIVEQGTDSVQNIFYRGNEVVARQVISKDGKVTQEGTIPDGIIKFYDNYNKTSGEEYYQDGRKNGSAKTYYEDGKPRSEARYLNGKLLVTQEFYNSGKVFFEVDYHDGSNFKNGQESGSGRLFYPDGTLKYEWYITNGSSRRYKRSYNPDGTLRVEVLIDKDGNTAQVNNFNK